MVIRPAAVAGLILAGCVDPIQLGGPTPAAGRDASVDAGTGQDAAVALDAGPGDAAATWESRTVPGAEAVRWRSVHRGPSGTWWVAGEQSTVARFDGAEWTVYRGGVFDAFNAVFAQSETEVYAAGEAGMIHRFDGQSWTSLASDIAPWVDGDLADVDFYSIWGLPDGDVFIASNATFRVDTQRYRGVLWWYYVTADRWEWFPAELVGGIQPAYQLRADWAIASDELWQFDGQRYRSMRKPREGSYNGLGGLWVSPSGLVYVISRPDGSTQQLLVLSGSGWVEVTDLPDDVSLLELAGDAESERVFVCGSGGYLGEISGARLRTLQPRSDALPPLVDLHAAGGTIWAVGGEQVLRLRY
jgi:hypothetical protein